MSIERISSALTQLPSETDKAKVPSIVQAGTQSAAQDRTSFHSDTSSVQSLATQALQSPEVRQNRVDALRQSVRSDAYQVDVSRLASAIGVSGGK